MSPEFHELTSSSTAEVVSRIAALEPRLGDCILIAIDGRSCSGKTTLAAELEDALGAAVVHLEYLYHGWNGLEAGIETAVSRVLEPISQGETAVVPQWDWVAGSWGEPVDVALPSVLILEGVGAASASVREYASLTIWLEVPEPDRRARAQARDWDTFADHWDGWAAQEDQLFTREKLPDRADVVLVGENATVSDSS
jgi:uridine kinase